MFDFCVETNNQLDIFVMVFRGKEIGKCPHRVNECKFLFVGQQ